MTYILPRIRLSKLEFEVVRQLADDVFDGNITQAVRFIIYSYLAFCNLRPEETKATMAKIYEEIVKNKE
jgi:ADP-ribose pyrophosphatase YjhB (NUDIX family)